MKFKTGDRVLIIKSDHGAPKETIGKTGSVLEAYVNDDGLRFKVQLDETGDYWYYRPEELELVSGTEMVHINTEGKWPAVSFAVSFHETGMKVKTKQDALLHCFDLWMWCAVTGKTDKNNWPGWKRKGGYLEACVNVCPLCEFCFGNDLNDDPDTVVDDPVCQNCPIKWSGGDCQSIDSEFFKWANATLPKARSKWALEIAILALKALTGED